MTAAGCAGTSAGPVFALFRSILRLHRERLPPPMRAMGDTYVKSEFRRHLRSQTTEHQWKVFMLEWQRYAAMLGGTADQQAAATAAALQPAAAAGGCGSGGAPHAAPAGGDQGLASMTASIASGSADMTEQLLEHLSPDQRRRLVKLQQEALALGADMLGKSGIKEPPSGDGSQA